MTLAITEHPDANIDVFTEALQDFLNVLNSNCCPTPLSVAVPRGVYRQLRARVDRADGPKPDDFPLWFMHATGRMLIVEGGVG